MTLSNLTDRVNSLTAVITLEPGPAGDFLHFLLICHTCIHQWKYIERRVWVYRARSDFEWSRWHHFNLPHLLTCTLIYCRQCRSFFVVAKEGGGGIRTSSLTWRNMKSWKGRSASSPPPPIPFHLCARPSHAMQKMVAITFPPPLLLLDQEVQKLLIEISN